MMGSTVGKLPGADGELSTKSGDSVEGVRSTGAGVESGRVPIVYAIVALLLCFDVASRWMEYLGYSSYRSTLSSDALRSVARCPEVGFKDAAGTLLVVLILLPLVRRICLWVAVKSWVSNRPLEIVRSFASSSRFRLSRSKSWALSCSVFALTTTSFLWFVCRAPGRQLFEFWLFPSWFAVELMGYKSPDSNQVLFWGVTALTWFLLGSYLLHLLDIFDGRNRWPTR
jgi:hypothetical protein